MSELTKRNLQETWTPTGLEYLYTIDQIIDDLNHGQLNAIPRALCWMRELGSSVLLNWGEDDNLWECSWITGGKRYTSTSSYMTGAIVGSLLKVKHRAAPPASS